MMISYIPHCGSCRSLNLLNHSNFTHDFPKADIIRGISSNGRAPALHAGSTGIDTRILQDQEFCINGKNFLAFSSFFRDSLFLIYLFSLNAGSESRRPAKDHCITFTLNSTGKKVLVLHSLSPTAKDVEDDEFVSDDSGDVKERRFVNWHSLILHQSKW